MIKLRKRVYTMKKILTIIFTVLSALCLLFNITACNNIETNSGNLAAYTEFEESESFWESSDIEISKDDSLPPESSEISQSEPSDNDYYVLNTNSKKIHRPSCRYVSLMSSANYAVTKDLTSALENGYTKCKRCQPN